MENSRKVKDKRYEEKHKAERKAKCMVWGTSVPREKAERINEFLKKYGYTKVQLIEAGYEELLARHDTDFAKLKDGYDDFFGFEEVDKKENRITIKSFRIRRKTRWKENIVFKAIRTRSKSEPTSE